MPDVQASRRAIAGEHPVAIRMDGQIDFHTATPFDGRFEGSVLRCW
jgi:hypothetical protein